MNKQHQKTGLVLSGGGAKGAYQIGVIKALQENKIHFDVVSGASIGAFNAILTYSGNMEKAEEIWLQLNAFRLAKISKMAFMAPIFNFLKMFGDPHYRNIDDNARSSYISSVNKRVSEAAIAFITISVILIVTNKGSFKESFVSNIIIIMLWTFFYFYIGPLTERLNLAFFSNKELYNILENNIDWNLLNKANTNIYATVAKKVSLGLFSSVIVPVYMRIDKMIKEEILKYTMASMALPFGILKAVKKNGVYLLDGGLADNAPIYPVLFSGCKVIYVVHLTPKPSERSFNLLDPKQLRRRIHYIDFIRRQAGYIGFYKILSTKIQLDFIKESIDSAQRFFKFTNKGFTEFKKRRNEELEELKDQLPVNVRIIHISPTERLGWPHIGTLLFTYRKSLKLMKQGYDDAKKKIQEIND